MANSNVENTLLERWSERLAFAALIALLLVAALTMLDAALRWIGISRVYGLHDLREFVFAVVVAACFPVGLLRGSAITVRLLSLAMGKRIGHHADLIAGFVTLGFFAASTVGMFLLSLDFIQANRTTSTLGWPLSPWVLVTTIILLLACIAQSLRVRQFWREEGMHS